MTPDRGRPEAVRRALAREAAVGLGFGLAALVLTWPLAFSPGRSLAVRGDYFDNLWNVWWARTALFERGVSPFWTDMLHAPLGISLAHHTLSIGNAAFAALLSYGLGLEGGLEAVVFLHFWLSAWAFSLLARELTGDLAGSLLAGLLWSFGPYHAYYLAQLNLTTLEFLPLAAWFAVRRYRTGAAADGVGLALCAALLTATDFYYVVYAGALCAALLLGGRVWEPGVAWRLGARRLWLPGAAAAGLVVLVGWPLLSEAFDAAGEWSERSEQLAHFSNDLLGFHWIGGPENVVVSWPTMLGYTTLGVLVAGFRGARQRFWLALLAVCFVLSLGPELDLAGRSTGLPLPHRALEGLPLLSKLRKPERFTVLILFAVAVLVAFAWRDLAARIGARSRVAAAAVAAAMALELSPAPLASFASEPVPYFREIARDASVDALVDLPVFGGNAKEGRNNRDQTLHGKRMPQGYVTSLALLPEHGLAAERWQRAYESLTHGDAAPLLREVERDGIDLVVLRKQMPFVREPGRLHRSVVWVPFRWVRGELVGARQRGHLVEREVPPEVVAVQLAALSARLGPPEYEDASLAVFRRR